MQDVLKIELPKAKIMQMPPRDRAMFFLLGYAANQLALYTKLAIVSGNNNSEDKTENKLSAAQTLMILRTVVGVIHETWAHVITKHFLRSEKGKTYINAMDDDGQKSLASLKTLFGNSGLLANIRNNFAFHYPDADDVEKACQLAAADPDTDTDWHWYFAKSGWNSFYFLSESMIMHGVLRAAGASDFTAAQQRLANEINIANNELVVLIQSLIAAMWRENFAEDFQGSVATKLHGAPNLFSFSLPYFFTVPDGE